MAVARIRHKPLQGTMSELRAAPAEVGGGLAEGEMGIITEVKALAKRVDGQNTGEIQYLLGAGRAKQQTFSIQQKNPTLTLLLEPVSGSIEITVDGARIHESNAVTVTGKNLTWNPDVAGFNLVYGMYVRVDYDPKIV